jgi:hypothetical protein
MTKLSQSLAGGKFTIFLFLMQNQRESERCVLVYNAWVHHCCICFYNNLFSGEKAPLHLARLIH